MGVEGAEAHGGPAGPIFCPYTDAECAKAKSGSGGKTHAGKEGVHVTNLLLRYTQNPVIELYPHMFLQEEGCYNKTGSQP